VLRWVGTVLEALVVVHAAHLSHSALRPSNVFLVEAQSTVKVLDFGLGLGGGDAASDLVAVGHLLYELLTGTRAVMSGDFSAEPPRPSTLRHDLPWGVDELVLWALDTMPGTRPANAAALLERLRQVQAALRAPEVRAPLKRQAEAVTEYQMPAAEAPLELAREVRRRSWTPAPAAPPPQPVVASTTSSRPALLVVVGVVLAIVAGLFGFSRYRALRRAEEPVAVSPQEPSPPGETLLWTTVSPSGSARVTAVRVEGHCSTRCAVRESERWVAPTCVAGEADHRFVSDDCATFVSLTDAPIADPALARSVVGTVRGLSGEWVPLRLGRVLRRGADGQLVDGEGAPLYSSVNRAPTSKWFAWLKGALGAPGARPGYSADGQGVRFDTIDGGRHLLPFQLLSEWSDAAATGDDVEAAQRADDSNDKLYQWVDDEGSTQVTPRAQVPAKARAKAKLLISQ
jgi:hypothetical protein